MYHTSGGIHAALSQKAIAAWFDHEVLSGAISVYPAWR